MLELPDLSHKTVIMFDLDGTLAESKSPLDAEMAGLLAGLLAIKKVAVIGGGSYGQFERQFLAYLACPPDLLQNLFLLPLSGGAMYAYRDGAWQKLYEFAFSPEEKAAIMAAFDKAFRATGYAHPSSTYGPVIEDRGSQVTFSALGQEAPVAAKTEWNRTADVRPALIAVLEPLLPDCEVRFGGLTSIDVTKKGIDKAYGIGRVMEFWHVPIGDVVYIGDALEEGGNDSAATRTGAMTVDVANAEDTKELIRSII